ncbi:hypothetical protein QP027_03135 [Corynebacterium breve]|uniref:Serine/threonine protein kinase n=1 Tax=Corynebacterium breve TaxID=3049799 RepID=A0ABY8VHI1_9CORY|nr:hypothetical protein [Corynebacterium breve]WIM68406.1 hypothetical protein QP027_03135 [Corynebacterium breve]
MTHPDHAQWETHQPSPPQKSRGGLIAATVAATLAVVLIAGAVIAYFLGAFGTGNSARPTVYEIVTETAASSATQEPSSEAPSEPDRPTALALPGGAVAVSGEAVRGEAAGEFLNVYTGSSVTSAPFAESVGQAFREHEANTGETNGTISAYSSVTGRSYQMTCTDNGSYVTCRGGNNAVVYIS